MKDNFVFLNRWFLFSVLWLDNLDLKNSNIFHRLLLLTTRCLLTQGLLPVHKDKKGDLPIHVAIRRALSLPSDKATHGVLD